MGDLVIVVVFGLDMARGHFALVNHLFTALYLDVYLGVGMAHLGWLPHTRSHGGHLVWWYFFLTLMSMKAHLDSNGGRNKGFHRRLFWQHFALFNHLFFSIEKVFRGRIFIEKKLQLFRGRTDTATSVLDIGRFCLHDVHNLLGV